MINKKIIAFALAFMAAGAAQAKLINVDSYFNGGPFDREVELRNPILYAVNPGRYKVEFLKKGEVVGSAAARYSAWNPWRNVSNCDAQGTNCQNGWTTHFRYDFGRNTDYSGTLVCGEMSVWATPELAIAAAKQRGPQYITVTEPSIMRIYLPDNWHYDNIEGVSFNITRVRTSSRNSTEMPGSEVPGIEEPIFDDEELEPVDPVAPISDIAQ